SFERSALVELTSSQTVMGHTVLYNFVYCLHLCKAICRLKLQFNVDSSPIQLLAAPSEHWFAAQHATCFECCATSGVGTALASSNRHAHAKNLMLKECF
ncbi:hypothetical protein, partial [Slackia isoflavoniconvertens]|uniref:hypothetical protein n=1 Tax=Slackia isoflavoniconvertens TaxID=572010 RepID=UPI003FD71EFC